jgi:NAD-dependent dihydropyrimidine dehydrogenase PreA subunit
MEEIMYVINDECVACGTCAEECPEDAISEAGDVYEIDQDKCVECGSCVEVCPTEAIDEK